MSVPPVPTPIHDEAGIKSFIASRPSLAAYLRAQLETMKSSGHADPNVHLYLDKQQMAASAASNGTFEMRDGTNVLPGMQPPIDVVQQLDELMAAIKLGLGIYDTSIRWAFDDWEAPLAS